MSVISGSLGAVMGADAQDEAAKTAANAQLATSSQQKQIYDQMRADFEPYRQVGLGAIPALQNAVLGNWEPNQSPAAKYQLRQGNLALMRGLGARGLAGSGLAPYKLGELSSQVAASDYQNQYNRLLDLVKIGTGASAATGGAAQGLSSAYGQAGTNLANIYSQMGANKASLYSGMGAASANTFGSGMKLYDYGKGAGWWGGSGAGAGAVTDADIASAYGELEYML